MSNLCELDKPNTCPAGCYDGEFPLETFGCVLKRLRERYNISQTELSRRTNLSVSFISSVENGHSQTSISNARNICKALNTPLQHVCEFTEMLAVLSDG